MKKLSNVSPFLLLLFPVLIMMILALATNNPINQNEETATITTNSILVKASTAILR